MHLFNYDNQDIVYNIEDNAKLIVYQYGFDIDNNVVINLNGNDAEVEYHYSVISYKNVKYNILVNHNNKNTISNIYNHGLNTANNNLNFNITGKVLKSSDKCICNQENQIINIKDGNSTILPNLLIDTYDVISSHSAYIGKIKDKLMFYLMSRGISKEKSYELLIKSFLINSSSSDEDRKRLEKEIKNIWR